jgi:hypothetical protein
MGAVAHLRILRDLIIRCFNIGVIHRFGWSSLYEIIAMLAVVNLLIFLHGLLIVWFNFGLRVGVESLLHVILIIGCPFGRIRVKI